MNTKLQELTDKIYLEGIEKANAEAAEILSGARKEAAEIVSKAQNEAVKEIKSAEDKSNELMKNTRSELKLFAQQSVNALKSEITNLICGSIVSDAVKVATTDKVFMQKMLLSLVEGLAKDQQVIVEAKDAKALTAYFESNAKALLNKGVTIKEANGIKADFTVIPAEGGYKLTFGEEELIAYFKEFLRPKLVEMLF
jgi:V/A-type H+-transporting ATPase subunit E